MGASAIWNSERKFGNLMFVFFFKWKISVQVKKQRFFHWKISVLVINPFHPENLKKSLVRFSWWTFCTPLKRSHDLKRSQFVENMQNVYFPEKLSHLFIEKIMLMRKLSMKIYVFNRLLVFKSEHKWIRFGFVTKKNTGEI